MSEQVRTLNIRQGSAAAIRSSGPRTTRARSAARSPEVRLYLPLQCRLSQTCTARTW